MKLLRHKEIIKETMPAYLKTKEMLDGAASLNRFLNSIRGAYMIYEDISKSINVRAFSSYNTNPLNKYLDNE